MRHAVHSRKGRTAFEIDEHEIELIGRMAQGQGEYQRSQHLGFARTGRTDQHAMRAHASLTHLLDVEIRGAGVIEQADRCAEPFLARPICPQCVQIDVADVADAQQIRQFGGFLACICGLRAVGGAGLRWRSAEATRDGEGLTHRQSVRFDSYRLDGG